MESIPYGSRRKVRPNVDRDEIAKALALLLAPGQVTELRVLEATTASDHRPHVESGYYDDASKLADAVSTIKTAKGVYVVPNEVNPALLARAKNRIRAVGKEPTTSDHDILRRRWLLVDIDPGIPAGISSSEAEHGAALELAETIRVDLALDGWPAPIIADSGNGAHVLYRVDLPADDGRLVQRVLESLKLRYDKVDVMVHNPARIWKLYGTLSCKGDDTPERPHRMARILEAPEVVQVVDTALLEALAAKAPNGQRHHNDVASGRGWSLDDWIARSGLEVRGPEPWQGGRKWILTVCPWNSAHTNDSAYIIEQPSGAIGAGCHHNGCHGKNWHDLRDIVEPARHQHQKHPNGASPVALPHRPFPVEALPGPCRQFVVEAATAIGCDISYTALPTIACLARAIGNTRTIRLKRTWHEPAIIWGAIVGKSGTHKSPAMSAATTTLARKQADAIAQHAEAVAQHEQARAQYERDYAAWKRSKSTDPPPWEPKEPHCRRYICSDVTIEALAALLDGQPDGVLVVRDELAGWVDGIGEYKGGKGSDTGHWLACWSGAPMTVDRKTGDKKMIYVPRASVGIVGGIQPGILRRAIAGEHMKDGMCARLLLAMPEPRLVKWTEATVSPATEAALANVFGKLLALEAAADEEGNPAPFAMPMTPEAKVAWVAYYDRHRAEMVGLDDDLAAAWSKLEAYAARFALIVQLCSWAAGEGSADVIDHVSIEAGIALSDWFGHEARRVYDVLAEDMESNELRELTELIQKQGGTITARKLTHCSRAHRGAGEAEAALERLAKAGLGRWAVDSNTGGRPASVFILSGNGGNGNGTPANIEENGLPLPLPACVTSEHNINARLAEAAEEDA